MMEAASTTLHGATDHKSHLHTRRVGTWNLSKFLIYLLLMPLFVSTTRISIQIPPSSSLPKSSSAVISYRKPCSVCLDFKHMTQNVLQCFLSPGTWRFSWCSQRGPFTNVVLRYFSTVIPIYFLTNGYNNGAPCFSLPLTRTELNTRSLCLGTVVSSHDMIRNDHVGHRVCLVV
jgi:hypothetical protein